MKAKSLFYNCKISSASSPKELCSITNNLLAKTKSTPPPTLFLLPDLPGLSSTFFVTKSSNSGLTLLLSLYAPVLYLWQIHLTASRFALSSLFLSLSLRILSWSQPQKLVNLIRFLLPCLWNVSTLSFLLSLLSLIFPYPLASFPKFSKLLLLHLSSRKNLSTRMNWRTIILSLIFPLSPR